MAAFNWRLGHRTDSSIRLMVQSDTAGTLSAVVEGVTYTGDAVDPATEHGNGKIDITGVSGSLSISLQLDDVEVTVIEVSTLSIKDTYRVAWGSCAGSPNIGAVDAIVSRYQCDAFVNQGDMPYTNGDFSDAYGTATDHATDQSLANMLNHHKRFMQGHFMQRLARSCSYFYSPDDHEFAGDNMDNTIFQMFGQISAPKITSFSNPPFDSSDAAHTPPADVEAATYANMETVRDIGRAAITAYQKTNPDMLDPEIGYFTWKTPTDSAEFFHLDCVTRHKSPSRRGSGTGITDKGGREDYGIGIDVATLLGVQQRARLKSDLLNSTATFKIIFSSKKTLRTNVETGDGWAPESLGATYEGYQYELADILAYIEDNGITGVVWLSGDRHYPHMMQTDKTNGPALETVDSGVNAGRKFDHCCVCACPIGLSTTEIGNLEQPAHVKWIPGKLVSGGTGPSGLQYTFDQPNCFGLVEIIDHERLDVSVCLEGGKKIKTWQLYAGENRFREFDEVQKSVSRNAFTARRQKRRRASLEGTYVAPGGAVAPTWGAISNQSLDYGDAVGINLNTSISNDGGDPAIFFTETAGDLPAGITLNSNGTFSGTVQEIGTFNPVYNAHNSGGDSNPDGTHQITVASLAPTFTAHPIDKSTVTNSSVTFGPVAVTSGPPASLQWQDDQGTGTWTNIAGETGASLTFTPTDTSKDGWQYRCVADNGIDAAVNSNVATLTVVASAFTRIASIDADDYTAGQYPCGACNFLVIDAAEIPSNNRGDGSIITKAPPGGGNFFQGGQLQGVINGAQPSASTSSGANVYHGLGVPVFGIGVTPDRYDVIRTYFCYCFAGNYHFAGGTTEGVKMNRMGRRDASQSNLGSMDLHYRGANVIGDADPKYWRVTSENTGFGKNTYWSIDLTTLPIPKRDGWQYGYWEVKLDDEPEGAGGTGYVEVFLHDVDSGIEATERHAVRTMPDTLSYIKTDGWVFKDYHNNGVDFTGCPQDQSFYFKYIYVDHMPLAS